MLVRCAVVMALNPTDIGQAHLLATAPDHAHVQAQETHVARHGHVAFSLHDLAVQLARRGGVFPAAALLAVEVVLPATVRGSRPPPGAAVVPRATVRLRMRPTIRPSPVRGRIRRSVLKPGRPLLPDLLRPLPQRTLPGVVLSRGAHMHEPVAHLAVPREDVVVLAALQQSNLKLTLNHGSILGRATVIACSVMT